MVLRGCDVTYRHNMLGGYGATYRHNINGVSYKVFGNCVHIYLVNLLNVLGELDKFLFKVV